MAEVRVLATGARIDLDPEGQETAETWLRVEPSTETRAELAAVRRGEAVYVRATAFIEVELDASRRRWDGLRVSGRSVSCVQSATSALLAIGREAADEGVATFLADLGIAETPVTRWEIEAAPRRLEIDGALRERLVLD